MYPENPKQTPEEHTRNFAVWVLGYYDHGANAHISDLKVDGRPEDSLRAPTVSVMPLDYQESAIYPPAGAPDGIDAIMLFRGIKYGMFNALRNRALYLDKPMRSKTDNFSPKAGMKNRSSSSLPNHWPQLKVVHVWCDQSAWVMPYGMLELKAELASAKAQGRQIRNVKFVKLEGLNHLVSLRKSFQDYFLILFLSRRHKSQHFH